MNSNLNEFILLCDALKINKQKILKFVLCYGDKNDVFDALKNNNMKPFEMFSQNEIGSIKNAFLSNIHVKTMQKLEKLGIKPIFYGDNNYPERLVNIDNSPVVIYTIGDVELLSSVSVSIIGSREPTRYGKDVAELFSKTLAMAQVVTVSGLAYGIDGIVAQSTIEVNGKTIAVLAGGLDKIYPSSHTALARQIIEKGGLILSEYLPGVAPQKHFFIARNRLIAALSLGLVVVEAGEKSGTLITARYAINYGRELFVVPGNINSEKSLGTNKLISELPDSFTISPAEIIGKLGIKYEIKPDNMHYSTSELSSNEKLVIECLKSQELSFDELQELTQIDVKILSTLLTSLEISGLIKKLPGNYYSV